MKKVSSSLKAMFTSWKITLILLVHYVILLATATFVEKAQGMAMAREIIYNNPLFYLLQFLCYCLASPFVEPAQVWSLTVAYLLYCNLAGSIGDQYVWF